MSFVRTVLGDIAPTDLGVCYAHEHIIIDTSYVTEQFPDFLLDSTKAAIEELTAFHARGGRSMIDSMPCDAGRNVRKLAEISRATEVHIVAPTGLHLPKYYPPHHWSHRYPVDAMAALFQADIEEGIDRFDYSGPRIERTPHRAGVIKIASGSHFTAREERIFAAAASAHLATGCPILTHTEKGRLALEQIEILREHRVNLDKVCISHTDRNPDPVYHREILASGVKLEFDSAFRWKPGEGNPTLDLCLELMPDYPNQILLGMDAARRVYWSSYGGKPGLTFLLARFSDQLEAGGLSRRDLKRIFVENPAKTFSFLTRV